MPRKEHGPHPQSYWLMLQTAEQMRQTAARYQRLGYKYIIGWRDARGGFGLRVVRCVAWVRGDAYIHLQH